MPPRKEGRGENFTIEKKLDLSQEMILVGGKYIFFLKVLMVQRLILCYQSVGWVYLEDMKCIKKIYF